MSLMFLVSQDDGFVCFILFLVAQKRFSTWTDGWVDGYNYRSLDSQHGGLSAHG